MSGSLRLIEIELSSPAPSGRSTPTINKTFFGVPGTPTTI